MSKRITLLRTLMRTATGSGGVRFLIIGGKLQIGFKFTGISFPCAGQPIWSPPRSHKSPLVRIDLRSGLPEFSSRVT